MMWEWRVFFDVSGPTSDVSLDPTASCLTENYDIWRLLDCRPRTITPDTRTDVYIACSSVSGVKLRSGRSLEVKFRCDRHENGAEKWCKVNLEVYLY